MASKTTKLVRIRERKAVRSGLKRKNHIRKHGSTAPNLPLNVPNAHEAAQKKAARA